MSTNKIGKISKNHRTLFLLALLVFFLSFCVCEVNAYSGGGGTCDCGNGSILLGGNATDACVDCSAALNDNTNCANQVNYVGTVQINNHTGICINNPANFSNKIFDCQGHTIEGNGSGSEYGIYLNGKSGNIIKNCVVTSFFYGIYLNSFSNNNTLINNAANLNSGVGIYLGYASNNTLINNTANSNSLDGIYLNSSSNNNTLTNNTANSNGGVGIYLLYSSNNTLINNTANSSWNGIYLTVSSNNILTDNTANSNSDGNLFIFFLKQQHPNKQHSKFK